MNSCIFKTDYQTLISAQPHKKTISILFLLNNTCKKTYADVCETYIFLVIFYSPNKYALRTLITL